MVEYRKKIGLNGQIIIPKILRRMYNMRIGDELTIIAKEEVVLIKKQNDNIVGELKEIAVKVNMKEKLNQKSLKKLREEQYEERARRAGIIIK